jgi:cellulose synthase/poly-beta-1,6-N-acetylglucosamine synthase-like glycosyltransferase
MMIILIILLTLAGFFTLYLSFLTVAGFLYKPNDVKTNVQSKNNRSQKKHHFAIIVPAHNEELVIEKTVAALMNTDYPPELFCVIVVADNCTDKTPIYASGTGAVVLERENKNLKGKGYALEWCFELLLKSHKPFDAFLVIDADTIVSKDILKILDTYLTNGSEAIQCADLVQPNPGAWSSEITRVGLYLYNYAKPLGRKVLNCSVGLRGNGMCFTADLLKMIPWQAHSQTEDLEYGLILLLNGFSVTFAPEAKVYAVMPANPQNAATQRARWEFGRFPLIKKYTGLLFKEAVRKRSFKIFDSLIELLTPAFVNLFLVTVLMFLLITFLTAMDIITSNTLLFISVALPALQVFYVIGGLYLSNADSDAYKALWNAPKYAVWKLILYVKLLIKGHTKLWIRTARE